MANITFRTSTSPTVPSATIAKGTALTFDELDGNLKSLNNDIATRADNATVVAALNSKVDTATYSSALALKADATSVTSALALKANIASPTFTGTVGGITATMVGLGNVDNTSDVNKPVSTAQATAIGLKADTTTVNLKAPLASPTFTGLSTFATLAQGTSVQTLTGTQNLDLSVADIFQVTLAGNCTLTFTNPPASGKYKQILVILIQDATGSRTCTFTNARWTDGPSYAPTLTTTANAKDVLTFFTIDAGANYFGSFVMANVS